MLSFVVSQAKNLSDSLTESQWFLRALAITSVSLQIVLTLLGSRRKYLVGNGFRFIVWLAYTLADWPPLLYLGILCSHQASHPKLVDVIKVFWAPFLLLHLGGPDSITAYSSEDIEFWLRFSLSALCQVAVNFYILCLYWLNGSGSPDARKVDIIASVVFVIGIVKAIEKAMALCFSSTHYLKKSTMDRVTGGIIRTPRLVEQLFPPAEKQLKQSDADNQLSHDKKSRIGPEVSVLLTGWTNFYLCQRFFADKPPDDNSGETSQSVFLRITGIEAFKVIEVELSFMYDLLYTKACVIHSWFGRCSRFVTLCCLFIASKIITPIIYNTSFSEQDVIITYVLLLGAIITESYALSNLFYSDWRVLWLGKCSSSLVPHIDKAISHLRATTPRRWSKLVAQCNLISFCLDHTHSKLSGFWKIINLDPMSIKHDLVPAHLEEFILEFLQQRFRSTSDVKTLKQLCTTRGYQTLKENDCADKIGWSVDAEFEHSIIVWHVATNICYYSDLNQNLQLDKDLDLKCSQSKLLSEYMLALLVVFPSMLPSGIGSLRLEDVCAEATAFFKEINSISDMFQACSMLLQAYDEASPTAPGGNRCRPVLFDGIKLAKSLLSLEGEQSRKITRVWETIHGVWLEMLFCAAIQGQWRDHARQLVRGGELLTHVRLLMAHMGVTEQFRYADSPLFTDNTRLEHG